MTESRKMFIFVEGILAILILLLIFGLSLERDEEDSMRVSVILEDSDDNQWAAFRYGLRMAAEDQEMEMVVVSLGHMTTPEDEEAIAAEEIDGGASAVIIQPVPGMTAERLNAEFGKKLPVMLVENAGAEGETSAALPLTEPDHEAMGRELAEEFLRDFNDNLEGKTLGLLSDSPDSAAAILREKGFLEALEGKGASISWSAMDSFRQDEGYLEAQPKVDFVIAFDDNSLTMAGKCSAGNNLHGAQVYGIGNSTEAVYYLDIGVVECLVTPDDFTMGYRSMTELARKVKHTFYKMKGHTVSHKVLRREELFTAENQEILYTMSQ